MVRLTYLFTYLQITYLENNVDKFSETEPESRDYQGCQRL